MRRRRAVPVPDGSQLWLSGRYDYVVYVLSAVDGSLITKIESVTARTAWP